MSRIRCKHWGKLGEGYTGILWTVFTIFLKSKVIPKYTVSIKKIFFLFLADISATLLTVPGLPL